MDYVQDEPSHVAVVDDWLARSFDHASPAEIVITFRAAFEAVWGRAAAVLGTVTLTAIARPALARATRQYAFLSAIDPCSHGVPGGRPQVHERLASVPAVELIEGLRFGLLELLTAIGRLTAELLSPELHAALAEITAHTPGPRRPTTGPAAGRHTRPARQHAP